jgi:ketosteroid isomerase-like protein
MGERDDFLRWYETTWKAGEDALHAGDAGPRLETWSAREPVTLFGAWFTATDSDGARAVFRTLAGAFSAATSCEVDLIVADVRGDLAYTVQRETTSTVVDGEPRSYVLRVTQVYRRENGEWRVAHRHADGDPGDAPVGDQKPIDR